MWVWGGSLGFGHRGSVQSALSDSETSWSVSSGYLYTGKTHTGRVELISRFRTTWGKWIQSPGFSGFSLHLSLVKANVPERRKVHAICGYLSGFAPNGPSFPLSGTTIFIEELATIVY